MSVPLLGVEMTPDIRAWDRAQRHVGSLLAIGAAALLVLVGLVTYAFAGDAADALYWVLAGLLALVLLYEVAILALGLRAETAARPAATTAGARPAASPWAPPGEPVTPRPAEAAASSTLTLRCGDCGTVFDVHDAGERPLYHNCPGCGAEGVLRDAPAVPRPAVEPRPAPQQPRPVTPRPIAEPRPVPTPAPKRLKLRCGGCKEIFAIEDTGERPLRRQCPHCGRLGEIR